MTFERSQIEAHEANWLPLPCEMREESTPQVEEDDLFTKGEVASFHLRQGYGYVRNSKGEDIIFRLDEAELVGPKGEKRYISEGSRVGFDVAWTSKGVHITKLKVY